MTKTERNYHWNGNQFKIVIYQRRYATRYHGYRALQYKSNLKIYNDKTKDTHFFLHQSWHQSPWLLFLFFYVDYRRILLGKWAQMDVYVIEPVSSHSFLFIVVLPFLRIQIEQNYPVAGRRHQHLNFGEANEGASISGGGGKGEKCANLRLLSWKSA